MINFNCYFLENQVTFICHIRRGVTDDENVVTYEYVQFTGYFSKDTWNIVVNLIVIIILINFRR